MFQIFEKCEGYYLEGFEYFCFLSHVSFLSILHRHMKFNSLLFFPQFFVLLLWKCFCVFKGILEHVTLVYIELSSSYLLFLAPAYVYLS